MNEEQRRKLHLLLYSIATGISLAALYFFLFVFDGGAGCTVVLTLVGVGWLLSALSGLLQNGKRR